MEQSGQKAQLVRGLSCKIDTVVYFFSSNNNAGSKGKVVIKSTEFKGLGVFAKESIEKGQVILSVPLATCLIEGIGSFCQTLVLPSLSQKPSCT